MVAEWETDEDDGDESDDGWIDVHHSSDDEVAQVDPVTLSSPFLNYLFPRTSMIIRCVF